MSKRVRDIYQLYKNLGYEIDKWEALKKISIFSRNLKFKDNDDFLDRFSTAINIIENNLSLFTSASSHVDIINTILEFLHTINIQLTFNHDDCDVDEIVIIYMMCIVYVDPQIPSFLRTALIDNSRLNHVNQAFMDILCSNFVIEMIIFEDSDLHAVVNCLKISPFSISKLNIYLQESIKEKFLWYMEKHCKDLCKNSNCTVSTFRTKKELNTLLPLYTFVYLNVASIWSEDIVAAKMLAMTLGRHITFINAHLDFCSAVKFPTKWITDIFDVPTYIRIWDDESGNEINPNKYTGSVYNLFYNGEWTEPVKNTYWIHNDNTYAQATKEDVSRCVKSAEEAFNKWRFLSIASRKDILKNLASTLECNGKFLLADTVEKCIKLVNFNNPVQCRGRLEVTNMYAPRGIVGIIHENEVKLFEYLASALILGNCAIVICNKNSCNVASYFNMFSTAEIPAGVINLLLNRNICEYHKGFNLKLDNLIENLTFTNSIIFPLIQFF